MATAFFYREVTQFTADDLNQLSQLLVDVVGEGASIGFLPHLSYVEARAYWSDVLGKHVKMWVAERDGVIVGTIQLHLATKPNSLHRAEIAKLMVHPTAGRQGIGRALLLMTEARARVENRSLLILDTREGDHSNQLYLSMGYQEAGRIPQYVTSADGGLDATVIYYKILS
ncbi:N-acetyltransferase [Brevibacillus reuszeri]|uniref:GCN5 family acetyltransferase n=1 Tax=Brevibacillus reuszeri TaxID=54915 RepID=A0A0K9YKN9_9BACL|nr:GNAT family N-acetyltransferase [Brevibacillus reuszeri]KNB69222.1 GCN5 family acetyltransferase [Brevibacillus reuszeri]MED1860159.1 GNAT family N-acetyltransferase [Brevibacillus reuszeri]GED71644.1 N-acetyltransferase [Brevibacillus reuszeri]